MNKELLYNFFQGKTSMQEEIQIRNWMEASPENRKLFLEERQLFDAMILLADEDKIRSYQKKNIFIGNYWIKEVMKIAAVIAMTLIGAYAYDRYTPKEELLAMQKITVPAGQRINLELSDGTVIWLNSRSTIQYPASFSGKNRTVQLNGEVVLDHGDLKVTPIEDYNVYRWKEGLICFKDETFVNIMSKFETCYGVTIKIENQKVINSRYTGKFRQSDGISYALRVLQKDVKFTFERNEENQIIYIK